MSLLKRLAVVAGAAVALTLALAAPASAHVTVNPNTAVQGGYAKVTFRVPNESDQATTTKVEINLPADAPFASVSLKPVAGWTMVAEKTKLATPIEAHGGQLTEAVSKITWTAAPAAAIKPGEFQEFDVSLGPLPRVPQVVFKALQTYSDGTIVRWIDEPTTDGTEPESPAPVLKLTAAPPAEAGSTVPPVPAAAEESSAGGSWTGPVSIGLGVIALVLGLLAYRRAAAVPAAAPAGAAEKPASAAGSAPTTAGGSNAPTAGEPRAAAESSAKGE
jgi:uncharacterized protein YcnI